MRTCMGRAGKGERVMLKDGMRMILCEGVGGGGKSMLGGNSGGPKLYLETFYGSQWPYEWSISENSHRLSETCHDLKSCPLLIAQRSPRPSLPILPIIFGRLFCKMHPIMSSVSPLLAQKATVAPFAPSTRIAHPFTRPTSQIPNQNRIPTNTQKLIFQLPLLFASHSFPFSNRHPILSSMRP